MSFKQKAAQVAMGASLIFFGISGAAQAADWNFYGSANVGTFYMDSDLDDSTNLEMGLNPGSAIGAEVTVSDSLSAGFEYGAEDGSANLVLLYGQWHFGAGSLMVGQNEVPVFQGISGQVVDDDRGLDGLGEFNPGERAQIRLAVGTLQIAIVEPDVAVSIDDSGEIVLDDGAAEVKMPALHVKYGFEGNNWDAGISGAAAKFDYADQSVTSYVAVASMGFTLDRLRLMGQGWMGRNVGNLAAQDVDGSGENGYAVYEGGQIHDVDAWGIALAATYVFNDMISMEAGYGYVDLDYGDAALFGADDDKVQSYYLNLPITLAEGVTIVPEIGVIDYDRGGQDKISYGGAKWQIEF